MEIGIIVKPSAWLYGTNYEITDELFMGWAVKIVSEKNDWLEVVTHYGYHGYLQKETVSFCTAEELRQRDEDRQSVFISRRFSDIMDEPSVHGAILTTLSRGSFVTILPEVVNGYRRVELADGRQGYVPCVAYEYRKENDGYLYERESENYFINQKRRNTYSEWMFRERLVSYAKSYLGTQYRWAGKSAGGIDCSGLTFMCYQMSGILIYRDAKIKKGYPVHEISMEMLKPGDLIYFPGHIGMYTGDCRYIHATGNERSFGCVINSLCKTDLDYRADLAKSVLMAGSIF